MLIVAIAKQVVRTRADGCAHDVLIKPLVAALTQATSREILLWMTPSEAPKALQASECSELLDPTGASCWIFAQR